MDELNESKKNAQSVQSAQVPRLTARGMSPPLAARWPSMAALGKRAAMGDTRLSLAFNAGALLLYAPALGALLCPTLGGSVVERAAQRGRAASALPRLSCAAIDAH